MRVLLLFFILFSFKNTFAFNCLEIAKGNAHYSNLKVVKEERILNKEAWYSLDVVSHFNYRDCIHYMAQKVVKIGWRGYRLFYSTSDSCDGGNTYGAVYTMDLKTPLIHIYDGDMYCKNEWRRSQTALLPRCDSAARDYATKMVKEESGEESGIEFVPHKVYIYGVEDEAAHLNVEGEVISDGISKARVVELEADISTINCNMRPRAK